MKTLVAGLALAGTLVAGSVSARAEQIVLKVAHFWPPTAMAPSQVLEPWCDTIAKESGDRLVCQIYPAMQLGGTPPQLIQQAIDGVADIVFTLPGYTAGRFPTAEVFELPFMTNRAEPASRALWEYCQTWCKEDFKDVHPLAFNVHDEGFVHSNKRAIKTRADFRGMKMRAPTRMTNRLLATLGATPVAMPMPAVPEAVSKGVIDGYLLPWEVVPTMKLEQMTKYHSETDPAEPALYTAVFTIAMNKARYESLPDDLKAIVDRNSGAALSAALGKAWDESAAAARKIVVESGADLYTVPAAELASWRKVGDTLTAKWIEEMDGRGLDGKAMVENARALIEKHSK